MIYKIGNMEYNLKDIIAISDTKGWDANQCYVEVWLRGCVEKTWCVISAEGEERNEDNTGFMNLNFGNRAKDEFEKFRKHWRGANA